MGSGPGDLAAAAAALGADTVGIDVAPSMVRRAAIANPSIPFRVGSFEAIPAGAGAFDAVVGNFVFNHVGRPETALAEARRVLRPGGWLALSTWDAPRREPAAGARSSTPSRRRMRRRRPASRRADQLPDRRGAARRCSSGPGSSTSASATSCSRRRAPTPTRCGGACSTRRSAIPPLVTEQTPEVQAAIRAAFDRLVAVHRRDDGTLAIPVAVQVTRGRRP